jgi:hypothetical protein
MASSYVVVRVKCAHADCQHKQEVHVGKVGPPVRETVVCFKCGRHFAVMLPDKIVSGEWLGLDRRT